MKDLIKFNVVVSMAVLFSDCKNTNENSSSQSTDQIEEEVENVLFTQYYSAVDLNSPVEELEDILSSFSKL